jgi:hypothetical protein
MGTTPRFKESAFNRRPFGSHRFDVYSPKLSRQLILFGMSAVDLWTTLEADPAVITFCERPTMLPDTRPQRAVDFWVKLQHSEEFLVLRRSSAASADATPAPSADTDGEQQAIDGIPVRYVASGHFDQSRIKLANWGWIIRDLAAFSRFVPEPLCRDVAASIGGGKSIAQLQAELSEFDSSTVKLAVYVLLHRGQAVCEQLATQALGPAHIIELP